MHIIKLISAAVGATVAASALAVAAVSPASAARPALPAPAAQPASAATGAWGNARTIPGLGALAKGGQSEVRAVSCAAPGNCVVGGDYLDGKKHWQAFVADEKNGHWGNAIEVPGSGALNKFDAAVQFLSCAPKANGDCTAAGSYEDSKGDSTRHVFVADEKAGHWGKAIQIPNLSHLGDEQTAEIFTLACGSAGYCTAGGNYAVTNGTGTQAFIADEKNGRWGSARTVPGSAALNQGLFGQVSSVSCPAAGICALVGFYSDKGTAVLASSAHAFAADEKNGTWGPAHEIPGTGTHSVADSEATAVSCATPGNCSATGTFFDSRSLEHAFVAAESGGTWRPAATKALPNTLGTDNAAGIACRSAGNCATAGNYMNPVSRAYVADDKGGRWRNAATVTGFTAFSKAAFAEVASLSCGAVRSCSAGGDYSDGQGHGSAFLVSEKSGAWGKAIAVPGLAALNKGNAAGVNAISCAAADKCLAGGTYSAAGNRSVAFIVTQS